MRLWHLTVTCLGAVSTMVGMAGIGTMLGQQGTPHPLTALKLSQEKAGSPLTAGSPWVGGRHYIGRPCPMGGSYPDIV